MTDWEEIKIPTFKETYGDYDSYLLGLLNSGGAIQDSTFDAKKVSGGFISSEVFLLHDGPLKKTLITAFHIPNKEGKIHHYDIHLARFRRKNKENRWTHEFVDNLRDSEVEKLKEFLSNQDLFLGKVPNKRFIKVLSSDSPTVLENLQDFLKLITKQNLDFSQLNEDGSSKVAALIKQILEGENVILEKKLYEQLKNSRLSLKSIKKYEDELKNFNSLIDKNETTETDMQNFLADKVWFFGLNYQQSHRRSRPKFNSTLGSEYDFLLEGFNNVYDIAELKGPNDPLFEEHNISERTSTFDNRIDYRFSTKFSRALHQVMDYLDEFEEFFERIKTNQPSIKNFMYPSGLIVISKRNLFPKSGKNSIKYLHLINRQFSNVEVLTYNDLATRAQIIVDFLKAIQ